MVAELVGNILQGSFFNLSDENLSFFRNSLSYLKVCDFTHLENKRYNIDGENIFMIISEYETKIPQEKKAEQHQLYFDIHYIISGQESIGVGQDCQNNQVIREYDIDKDSKTFGMVAHEIYLSLKKGNFAIFFSADIHRPGLDYEGQHHVRKAVIKVKTELCQ